MAAVVFAWDKAVAGYPTPAINPPSGALITASTAAFAKDCVWQRNKHGSAEVHHAAAVARNADSFVLITCAQKKLK